MAADSASYRRYSSREDELRPPLYSKDSANSFREVRGVQYLTIPRDQVRRASSTSRQEAAIPVREVEVLSIRSNTATSNSNLSRRPSNLEIPQQHISHQRSRSLSTSNPRPRRPSSSNGSTRIAGFRYKPLDPTNKKAIRILHVHRDTSRDGYICCDLSHGSIKEDYSALSYTWGSGTSSETEERIVLINDKPFPVRANLHAFLKYARRNLAGKPLWVDAICINQQDVDEKNRQVGMMWKIYSRTKEVLVWLGPDSEENDHVSHAIKRMKAYADMNDAQMALSSAGDDDFWKGFREINTSFYFTRVWVIQEFTLPTEGRIIQGDRWISFSDFQETIRRFDGKIYRLALTHVVFSSRRKEQFKSYISNIHPLWQRRLTYKSTSTSSNSSVDADWTTLSGVRHCQDLRDRVYGIMALSTHGDTLRVDYTLNPFQLLLESIWLEHDSDLDRTDIVMNLANILLLTPAAICLYAATTTSSCKYLLHKTNLPRDRNAAQALHLKAASSRKRKREWLAAATCDGEAVDWRNFASSKDRGSLKVPKRWPVFPGRKQCPWQMFIYCITDTGKWGLKLAVDARDVPSTGSERKRERRRRGSRSRSRSRERSKDRDRDRDKKRDRSRSKHRRKHPSSSSSSDSITSYNDSSEAYISPKEFMATNAKRAAALGVYKTTCAPVEMMVYYALADGLEGVGPSDNKAGALEEAMEGLQHLHLDI